MSNTASKFASLHPSESIAVQELCTIYALHGEVFAVFPTERDAEDCEVFFPHHKGFVCFDGYLNALKIA